LTIRIGKIIYTNTWPIFHFLNFNNLEEKVSLIPQIPAQLNQAMRKGDIDIGAISSFAYAESFNDYYLLPNLSVSALGKVNSILLFSKKPLKELNNSTIALPNSSATSTNLLKIILHYYERITPNYFVLNPNLNNMMENADAALLIGDDAIKAKRINHTYLVYDLGEEWFNRTKKWMTFAVFAVRKQIIDYNQDLLNEIYLRFLQSKKEGLMKIEEIIAEAINVVGDENIFWTSYFNNLSYDLTAEQISGLNYYFRLAKEIGLLYEEPTINYYTNNSINITIR